MEREAIVQVIYDKARQRVPIRVWASDADQGTLDQARNMANLPFAFHHIALMPDAHKGYGMPIGGVLAAKRAIVPYAVGTDIGCGMHARRTNIEAARLLAGDGLIRQALTAIQRAIPCGVGPAGQHKAAIEQDWTSIPHAEAMRLYGEAVAYHPRDLEAAYANSERQIGTLGAGNHFLELQQDAEGFVWLMLHSGSRGLGAKVCDHFDRLAQQLNDQWHSVVPKAHQLAFLPMNSTEGQNYLRWMHFCMAWARENRQRMLDAGLDALFSIAAGVAPDQAFLVTEAVDTHHNYAVIEHHFGENVLVHRKGAVRAREGEMVIVPGSMETASYVGRGKGNRESFNTAQHGAGRRLSRSAAKRERTPDQCMAALDAKGILLAKASMSDVAEEAGHAYKDVDQVMAEAADLVEPLYRLTPLGVLKG